MADKFICTRKIEIDAAHRVPDHRSKCFNVHGHRYVIEATCKGTLAETGEQTGMVVDFGFLKEAMMAAIDAPCDHGIMLWELDTLLANMRGAPEFGKVYTMPDVPTAENLARAWYYALAEKVEELGGGRAVLYRLKVWETPNCWAEYPVRP